MGLLLLLIYTLLSSYAPPGTVAYTQPKFTLKSLVLSIEPSPNVSRGTNVTLRCKAAVSSLEGEPLSSEYTIYRDNEKVYTKTSITSEDLLYPLPEAKVSNTGKYMCTISIEGKEIKSEVEKLTVTGLSKPILHLNNNVVTEGEEVIAKCTAPNETGSIFFYFYDDSKVIMESKGSLNQLEAKLSFKSAGRHKIHCTYTVSIMPDSFKSEESNTIAVSVRELTITPVIEIYPQSDIYEGDPLTISCTTRNQLHSSKNLILYLSQGTHLLRTGVTEVNYNMTALANQTGDFECRLEMKNIVKATSRQISVTELFSVPILTMFPAEVFQKDYMTLTCKSEFNASERLTSRELTYSLEPSQSLLTQTSTGVFSGKALQFDFNYTCVARAKGITKHSETLTVRPKVSVSTPVISVVGMAVVGEPFKILCQSATGSFPINYTLLKNGNPVKTFIVNLPKEKAMFQVTITRSDEISNYMCQAKNGHKEAQHSKRLNTTVIVPLTTPTLIVHPKLTETYEGNELLLICSITGTPPVTYKWYHNGNKLKTNTSNQSSMDYHVQSLNKDNSGNYHCEAVNKANSVRSDTVTIEVYMAMWKRALIGGVFVLVVIVLVVACVLYFKSKRGKREAAAELSVKPSSPKSDDSLTENLTHNTEVYNAATVRTDRAVVSVWTERPPDAASDEVSSVVSNEPDVEYTEVVHPQPMDPARVPLRKGTDTVYSELKNTPHGAADHHDYGSLEYAALNGEQPEINQYSPEVNNYQDLPVPVD